MILSNSELQARLDSINDNTLRQAKLVVLDSNVEQTVNNSGYTLEQLRDSYKYDLLHIVNPVTRESLDDGSANRKSQAFHEAMA